MWRLAWVWQLCQILLIWLRMFYEHSLFPILAKPGNFSLKIILPGTKVYLQYFPILEFRGNICTSNPTYWLLDQSTLNDANYKKERVILIQLKDWNLPLPFFFLHDTQHVEYFNDGSLYFLWSLDEASAKQHPLHWQQGGSKTANDWREDRKETNIKQISKAQRFLKVTIFYLEELLQQFQVRRKRIEPWSQWHKTVNNLQHILVISHCYRVEISCALFTRSVTHYVDSKLH